MNKENVLIYPYDKQFTPILRYSNFINTYNKITISSLIGWGLCDKDAGYADGGSNINIIVENKFDEYLHDCDTVIFTEPDNFIDYEKSIYPKIYSAIQSGKKIINLLNLHDKFNDIKEYCNNKNVEFINYRNEVNVDGISIIDKAIGILEINTPVISIVGVSENTNKYSLQLQTKMQLENMGYAISHIGSRAYCEINNSHSFPSFMFNNSISETDKIYLFNRFVNNIELKEKPDVIIIGVPGGIIPHNNVINNNFGITAFEVFQAITADALVVSVFHELYTSEFFESLSKTTKYRFGLDIDIMNITNRQIDWPQMYSTKSPVITYATLNSDYMNERIAQIKTITDIPIYNILNPNDSYNIVQILINKLCEDIPLVVF